MKPRNSFLFAVSAFIFGVLLACDLNPAVADVAYNAARYLSSTVYGLGDTFSIRYPRVLYLFPQTSDGSDNGQAQLAGGGNTGSQGRGGYIIANGNESNNGAISIVEGSNGGGVGITAGVTTTTGTFTSSRATDFGWAIVDQTDNQACTTGCTSAAVFGINLAAGATAPVIVGPSDATADVCLCAGAS